MIPLFILSLAMTLQKPESEQGCDVDKININCYGDFAGEKRLLVISDGQRRTPSIQYSTYCHF